MEREFIFWWNIQLARALHRAVLPSDTLLAHRMSWRTGLWAPREDVVLQQNYAERCTGDANGVHTESIPWEQRRWTQFSFENPIARPPKPQKVKREIFAKFNEELPAFVRIGVHIINLFSSFTKDNIA